MNDSEDTIDALAKTLDALDDHLQTSDATVRRSETNRLSMLHVHAGFAAYIGPLFALIDPATMRGPTWAVVRLIPGSPVTLGLFLCAGGVLLGLATWHRLVVWEMVGLCILLAWYFTMGVSFAVTAAGWYLGWRPAGGSPPAPYTHGLYLHFTTIMVVHLATLIRIRRARRKAAR